MLLRFENSRLLSWWTSTHVHSAVSVTWPLFLQESTAVTHLKCAHVSVAGLIKHFSSKRKMAANCTMERESRAVNRHKHTWMIYDQDEKHKINSVLLLAHSLIHKDSLYRSILFHRHSRKEAVMVLWFIPYYEENEKPRDHWDPASSYSTLLH